MMEALKALHIIAVISWMAGLLYLPRLFVYHAEAEKGSRQSETFKIMERRLFKAIMTPAMAVSWIIGAWLAWQKGWYLAGWFHLKLVLVIALSGFHEFLGKQMRNFAADENIRPAKFFRIINEAPTLLMIAIVFQAVMKPF